jgi:uncharacterized protein (TIGR00299 family) protein
MPKNIKMKTQGQILYYECFSGISGDMNLAAMIDLGVPEDYLRSELDKLGIQGYSLKVNRDSRNGIFGTRVDVILNKTDHHHRNLKDIYQIIDTSSLSSAVKDLSKNIFLKVAEAEAKIHEMPLEKIHFHEVGAIDSIVDIVGAAICHVYISPVKTMAGTIELGKGLVKSQHGIIPVPAPATAEILKGIPTHIGGASFETTTPTGAAILATIVDEFSDKLSIRTKQTGYGIGHKIAERPNMLRVYLGKTNHVTGNLKSEKAWMIECNIDDMNPEWYEFIIHKLFEAGAQDVYLSSITMKKLRPGTKLSVLSKNENLESIKEIILRESTTIGLRFYSVEKAVLERKESVISTGYGPVRVKSAFLNDRLVHQKPEYEDCKKIAQKTGMPLKEITDHITLILQKDRGKI